ncbi:MAG: YeeE/YedE thiosulfate transporter family protein [Ignavibacteriales bacterium]|nr:YeeE/YedE thiosulfate transporter family protein [Ignavibacteriales bacterium]
MGPLVPEVIGNELNFVVALFIGIAFGFILEQAGFSTSKKLVGLFYGYDFTVLRVFFTGGVTAMIGVVAFDHFGLLDISLVYVNPTFLWSALVGGLIMGLGFVIGGYCPGTSVCAAAIGKIDAMIFIGGSFIGVFVFAEGYPLFEGLYKSANWGSPRIFETLGMSQSLFAFLLTAMAVGAFWAVTLIENKVNGKPNPEFSSKPLYFGLTAIALLIGLSAFAMPDRKGAMLRKVSDENFIAGYPIKTITSDELAFRLIDDDQNLQIIDLRSQKEFDAMSLPKSNHFSLENIFEKDIHNLLLLKHKRNIFIANEEVTAKKGAVLAKELGFEDVLVLKGGLNQFKMDILNFKMPEKINSRNEADTYRFRTKANLVIPELIKENKLKQTAGEKKQVKRIVGGC